MRVEAAAGAEKEKEKKIEGRCLEAWLVVHTHHHNWLVLTGASSEHCHKTVASFCL